MWISSSQFFSFSLIRFRSGINKLIRNKWIDIEMCLKGSTNGFYIITFGDCVEMEFCKLASAFYRFCFCFVPCNSNSWHDYFCKSICFSQFRHIISEIWTFLTIPNTDLYWKSIVCFIFFFRITLSSIVN